jgi:hypothetical protein
VKPLLPRSDAPVIKYEVTFHVEHQDPWRRETVRKVVDVKDTGNEKTNQVDAILTASLVLDDEGMDHWNFKGVAKVTS